MDALNLNKTEEMKFTEFIGKVEEMRKHKRVFFNRATGPGPKAEAMRKAMRLEKEIDAAIIELKLGKQKELF